MSARFDATLGIASSVEKSRRIFASLASRWRRAADRASAPVCAFTSAEPNKQQLAIAQHMNVRIILTPARSGSVRRKLEPRRGLEPQGTQGAQGERLWE